MRVFAVTMEAYMDDDGYYLREGPIHISAENYSDVEAKVSCSPRYKDRKVAEITLLGDLDRLE